MLNSNTLFLFYLSLSVGLSSGLKPNIIMFLTDDQDIVMNGMSPMKNVQRYLANEGVTFTNSFVSSPICCPSRASILTGLYPHNHHTVNNSVSGGCYGRVWKEHHELNTFASILQRDAGYNTFYAGKYLNQYGEKESGGPGRVPGGWTEWHGLVGNSKYYNYVLSNNGVPTQSNDLYLTDVIRDLGLTFIENQTELQPFLMVLSPPAPHAPFTAAPRHKDLYKNATLERLPNFNIKSEDKHWLLRMPPSPLPEEMMPELERVFRSRWEALLSVDEMVADVVNMLESRAWLQNTYLIFTSDNGYHIGQFSQVYDKRQPYESDIRVPLIIRGPGIEAKTAIDDPVMNVDLAPTIIALAGLEPPSSMDGKPIELTKDSEDIEDRYMLIEYVGEYNSDTVDSTCSWKYDKNLAECSQSFDCKCQDVKNNTYGCIRYFAPNINIKYCHFVDSEQFEEIYDLAEDPYELKNIIRETLPALRHWYKLMLVYMLQCKGRESCNRDIDDFSVLQN